MSGSHIPLSTIKVVPVASSTSAEDNGDSSTSSTVTLTNTTSSTPRMIVPAVLIPNPDGSSSYAQFIPSATKGQSASSPGNFQPLIISGMSPGIQQGQNSVVGLLAPVMTQDKQSPSSSSTLLQNTKIISSAQATTLVLPQTSKLKFIAKGPTDICTVSAPPPLQPLTGAQHYINLNKLKHISGINQFKRIQPYPDKNESILKVQLMHGTNIADVKPLDSQQNSSETLKQPQCVEIETAITSPSQTSKPQVSNESKAEFINFNFTRINEYVNEFPQLITIHGLTTEKSKIAESVEAMEIVEQRVETSENEASTEEPPEETCEEPLVKSDDEEEATDSTVPADKSSSLQAAESEENDEKNDVPLVLEEKEINQKKEISVKNDEEIEDKNDLKSMLINESESKPAEETHKVTEETPRLTEEPPTKKVPRVFKRPSILGARKQTTPVSKPALLARKSNQAPVQDPCTPKNEEKTNEISEEGISCDASSETKDSEESLEAPKIDEKSMKPVSKDFDPVRLLDWQNGVGILPGSDLKFKMNEFGFMEIVDEEKDVKKNSSHKESLTHTKPTMAEVKKRARKEKLSPDDIYCCENCGCYGMACEFKSQRFCSDTCEEAAAKRRSSCTRRSLDIEEMKLRRKKKRQLQNAQQQLRKLESHSDEFGDKSVSANTPEMPSSSHIESLDATYTDTPSSTAQNSPNQSLLPSDEELEEEKDFSTCESSPKSLLPWQIINNDGKVQFSWPKYLDYLKARAAPTKLFPDHGFPYQRNGFRIGMRLEGIDPRMPSQFCAFSVSNVRGYRIKLHYEGWPDSHDFWVNADSRDIFLVGFCEKTQRSLVPPRGYPKTTFSWATYLKLLHASAAPRQLFLHRTAAKNAVGPSGFRLGMKLEAVDKHNPNLVCVATVADILDGRLLVHFDSWDHSYDYWAEPSSPYIHPVGWCEQNKRTLTPPNGYNNFNWDAYLKETKSTAVPSRAFKPKPPPAFKKGMKLECVDPRFPELIRVATIHDCKDHRIQIRFDYWPLETAIWLDVDSTDIHPLGWCNKTGHPLTPPPAPHHEYQCLTPGCRALMKNSQFILPHSSGSCPLATVNLNKPKKLPTAAPSVAITPKEEQAKSRSESSEREEQTEHKVKNKDEKPLPSELSAAKKKKMEFHSQPTVPAKTLRMDVHESVFSPGYTPLPVEPAISWMKYAQLLQVETQKLENQRPVKTWTPLHVEQFVQSLPGCADKSKIFIREKIDGEALLMLTQSDLINLLGLKMGPAIKLYHSITLLKQEKIT